MHKSKGYQVWKETLIQILGIKATEILEKKVKERMEQKYNATKKG